MKLYAYVRVSTRQQSLKRQIENIMSANGGAYAGAMFFSDKFTGSTLDRPEWNRLYKRLQPGDTVVFDSVGFAGDVTETVHHGFLRVHDQHGEGGVFPALGADMFGHGLAHVAARQALCVGGDATHRRFQQFGVVHGLDPVERGLPLGFFLRLPCIELGLALGLGCFVGLPGGGIVRVLGGVLRYGQLDLGRVRA